MEQLALAFRAGDEAPYFLGDNLDGYHEGVAFTETGGAGYVVRGRAFFRGFSSWRDELENLRARADGARLYPYGIRHTFGPHVWDELILLRQRRALALRLHSDRPRSLSLGPLFDLRGADATFEAADGLVLMRLDDRALFVAFASPQPFAFVRMERRDGFARPILRTLQAEGEFTLYACFASDPARACEQAVRLRTGDAVQQQKKWVADFLARSSFWCSDETYSRALAWAKMSSHALVTTDPGQGIWAGLPWFRENWGRDTFIALPGTLIATGQFEEAREVFRQFARWQNRDAASPDLGRIPNRVRGPDDIIYNTADGTLWFIREVFTLLQHTGDTTFAAEIYPTVKLALDGAAKKAVDKEGFLTHGDADTWMDARIEGKTPWSPRGNRACEIQALWYEALRVGLRLAQHTGDKPAATRWKKLADAVKRNFSKRFWQPKRRLLADHLAKDGTADCSLRPNALMALSVPAGDGLLDAKTADALLRKTCATLLYPYGIASLDPGDPRFHPYHDGRPEYHKDAAYHNGTVWLWNSGFVTTALVRADQIETAASLAESTADQLLHRGHRGTLSELVDAWPGARGKPRPSGTWAQAWSTAEFVRNAAQDFLGFRPALLEGTMALAPRMPAQWDRCSATLPFGRQEALLLNVIRERERDVYLLKFEGARPPAVFRLELRRADRCFRFEWEPKPADTFTVVLDRRGAMVGVNGHWQAEVVKGEALPRPPAPIAFARPDTKARPPALGTNDFLRQKLMAEPPAGVRKTGAGVVKRGRVRRRERKK